MRQQRILVAEDSFFLATHVTDILTDAGAEIVGPVSCISEALRALSIVDVQMAVFNDVLRGPMRADPLAAALIMLRVPFVRLSLAPAPLIGGPPAIQWPFAPDTLLDNLAELLTSADR
ncbi:hypothetical protein [Roseomonas sp. 18066]|uniref:hypothetical protein n=1 Tax=Roseomonas sp. 18066 TaxID=2681412 RepID=UPI00135AAB5E|nr:hypothetical protein [Roseomonas sp. 18066]